MTLLEKALELARKNNQAIGHEQKLFITLEQLAELLKEKCMEKE